MRAGDSVRLDPSVRIFGIRDPHALIAEMAAGKRILNVGAAGNAQHYLEFGADGWLHKRLAEVAAGIVGLDIDQKEIEAAGKLGYDIVASNCETITFEERFDLIVLSDVIEHLDNPGQALKNLTAHLEPGGRLVISTPNATSAGTLLRVLCGQPPSVYWDHVALYAPEHIQALCDRHSFTLETIALYTLTGKETGGVRFKSAVMAALGALNPRFHNAFLSVISPVPPAETIR